MFTQLLGFPAIPRNDAQASIWDTKIETRPVKAN